MSNRIILYRDVLNSLVLPIHKVGVLLLRYRVIALMVCDGLPACFDKSFGTSDWLGSPRRSLALHIHFQTFILSINPDTFCFNHLLLKDPNRLLLLSKPLLCGYYAASGGDGL